MRAGVLAPRSPAEPEQLPGPKSPNLQGRDDWERGRTRPMEPAKRTAGAAIYVGIDVSKAALDVAQRPAQAAERFPNAAAGIAELVGRLQQLRSTWSCWKRPGAWSAWWWPRWRWPTCRWQWSIPARCARSPARQVTWPRPTPWTLRYWRTLLKRCVPLHAPC